MSEITVDVRDLQALPEAEEAVPADVAGLEKCLLVSSVCRKTLGNANNLTRIKL